MAALQVDELARAPDFCSWYFSPLHPSKPGTWPVRTVRISAIPERGPNSHPIGTPRAELGWVKPSRTSYDVTCPTEAKVLRDLPGSAL
ncbi:gramicidin S synthetase 1 [Aspergillus luchuensis]|uniref:Gramicidin S synthetase 1 n=1 Tax=Aspergillus kawachii TaxID=1069201 RepID=A0A146G363_ASPKA|nr:gramicidin S synthetase 1 [Aspergillus luchuensis]